MATKSKEAIFFSKEFREAGANTVFGFSALKPYILDLNDVLNPIKMSTRNRTRSGGAQQLQAIISHARENENPTSFLAQSADCIYVFNNAQIAELEEGEDEIHAWTTTQEGAEDAGENNKCIN